MSTPLFIGNVSPFRKDANEYRDDHNMKHDYCLSKLMSVRIVRQQQMGKHIKWTMWNQLLKDISIDSKYYSNFILGIIYIIQQQSKYQLTSLGSFFHSVWFWCDSLLLLVRSKRLLSCDEWLIRGSSKAISYLLLEEQRY